MNKLIPLLFAGTGATTVTVGGFYLVKGNGLGPSSGSHAKSLDPSTQSGQAEPTLEFEDLAAFTNQPTKSKCVKDHFSALANGDQAQEISSNSKPQDNEFFTSPTGGDASAIKSCLKIEYRKTTYQNSKWRGKFTWLGTFTTGGEGFISFNIAETSDTENGKLRFSGIFYLVGKKGESGEVKHKKSISGDKKAGKGELDTYFPKPHTELANSAQPYWGFLSSNEDLDNACFGDDCKTASEGSSTPVKKEFTGIKGDDQAKSLKDWAENLTWWQTLYTNENGALDVKINSFKGTWTTAQV